MTQARKAAFSPIIQNKNHTGGRYPTVADIALTIETTEK